MSARQWVVLGFALAAAGCATPAAVKKTAQADATPSTMLVCELERPTGSNIPRRVCHKRELDEQDRRDIEELTRRGSAQIEK